MRSASPASWSTTRREHGDGLIMATARSQGAAAATKITDGWTCAALSPGRASSPADLEGAGALWFAARAPGTAASALAAASAWSFDSGRDFDAEDWWFRCTIDATARDDAEKTLLRFDGLATLADVWLDGEHLLRSDNMFRAHALDVTARGASVGASRQLVIRCSALGEDLKKRRPRPRWRAQTVAQQQLRFCRTSLLGRMPAWSPPVAPVGPYRAVVVERRNHAEVTTADVKTRVEGRDGVVDITLHVAAICGATIQGVACTIGDVRKELACTPHDDAAAGGESPVVARGVLRVPDVALWWTATHGTPFLYDVTAHVRTDRGEVTIDFGRTGFRTIDVDRTGDGFGLSINGVDVFARGAVWTPLDVVGLAPRDADVHAAVATAARAGMNMLRISGTMTYETAAFHDACDEIGVLVWQDFMFANMDYPVADPAFLESVRAEASEVVDRLQLSPSLAVLCGNSEVSQQAAMLGLPSGDGSNALFTETLPAIARAFRPDVAYVDSTPSGGALPFRVDAGVSHYYGLGAYLRPLDDARRSRVRFAAECLAFGNVPCDETIDAFMPDGAVPTTHPRWKARVPRDRGTGWDFDDVRDHYLHRLLGLDPVTLRSFDPARYLTLGRVVTGEAILAAFSEWRRAGSECRGALVWFLRDLWLGAGWGLVDAAGRPKGAHRYFARACAPVALLATDEGVNGLSLHAINERAASIDAEVRVALYRGETKTAEGTAPALLAPRSVTAFVADAILGRFTDTTYAYRFGPPGHDLVYAALVDRPTGECLGRAFHFPVGYPVAHAHTRDLGLEATAVPTDDGQWRVTVRAKAFAFAVAFDTRGFVADDEFFHIEPGGERTVTLRRECTTSEAAFSGRVVPANAAAGTKIHLQKQA